MRVRESRRQLASVSSASCDLITAFGRERGPRPENLRPHHCDRLICMTSKRTVMVEKMITVPTCGFTKAATTPVVNIASNATMEQPKSWMSPLPIRTSATHVVARVKSSAQGAPTQSPRTPVATKVLRMRVQPVGVPSQLMMYIVSPQPGRDSLTVSRHRARVVFLQGLQRLSPKSLSNLEGTAFGAESHFFR